MNVNNQEEGLPLTFVKEKRYFSRHILPDNGALVCSSSVPGGWYLALHYIVEKTVAKKLNLIRSGNWNGLSVYYTETGSIDDRYALLRFFRNAGYKAYFKKY